MKADLDEKGFGGQCPFKYSETLFTLLVFTLKSVT